MRALRLLWITAIFLILPGQKAVAQPAAQPANDRQLIEQAHLKTDGPALVEFFRKRASVQVEGAKVAELIRRLADPKPEIRDSAFGELVCFGTAAVPTLRRAANDLENPEIADQARHCLEHLEGKAGAELTAAVARLLRQQRPDGAVEALLAFLPLAEDEAVGQEVSRAITILAVHGGKVELAALRALEDPLATRRAAAVEALCQAGVAEHLPAVRKLLKDPKPSVRLRAAMGLTTLNEADAVPVLIDLLAELPLAQRLEAQQVLTRLGGEWSLTVPQGDDDVARRLRREAWASWWRALDGPTLIGELRKRTLSDADRERALALIQKLADDSPTVRDQGVAGLAALGPAIAPLLRQAENHPNSRVRAAATKCLQVGDFEAGPVFPLPVLRLVALRKPEGATEALLAFLPFAENARVAEETADALAAVALGEGPADPALLRALEDRVPERRRVAGDVLARSTRPEQREAARRLLKDEDPLVRLQIALTLAATADGEAVPALIQMLADLPTEQAATAEGFLLRLAGEKAPTSALKDDPAARKACHDAWAKWWTDEGAKIDLAKLDNPRWLFGQTLVVDQYEAVRRSGRVLELDARGKVCWEIDGLNQPLDAQVLPRGRVLVLEQNGQRLTERDLQGTIVWEKQLTVPAVSFRRLADGTTFVATRHQLMTLDAKGTEKVLVTRPVQDIVAAGILTDKSMAFVTTSQQYLRVNDQGTQVAASRIPYAPFTVTGWEFLPDGHVLAAINSLNKVAEIDGSGQSVWEATVAMPQSATRASNGITLVASLNGQRILELDRAGRVVNEIPVGLRPWRVHRR